VPSSIGLLPTDAINRNLVVMNSENFTGSIYHALTGTILLMHSRIKKKVINIGKCFFFIRRCISTALPVSERTNVIVLEHERQRRIEETEKERRADEKETERRRQEEENEKNIISETVVYFR
jgi:hypothetical protein